MKRNQERESVLHRLVSNPLLALLGLLLGIIASAATILGNHWPWASDESFSPPNGTSQSTPDISQSTPAGIGGPSTEGTGQNLRPSPAAITVGTCLAAGQAVPCDRPHEVEVIGIDTSASCDMTTLITALGGSSAIDVLTPALGVSEQTVAGQESCLATFAAPVSGSVQDGFSKPDHGQWRWCRDTKRRQATVGCTEPHDAEVVAVRAHNHSRPDCRAMATSYADTNWRNLEDTFTVKSVDEGQRMVCLLEALGDSEVHDSVRNIGTRTFPVGPRRS